MTPLVLGPAYQFSKTILLSLKHVLYDLHSSLEYLGNISMEIGH